MRNAGRGFWWLLVVSACGNRSALQDVSVEAIAGGGMASPDGEGGHFTGGTAGMLALGGRVATGGKQQGGSGSGGSPQGGAGQGGMTTGYGGFISTGGTGDGGFVNMGGEAGMGEGGAGVAGNAGASPKFVATDPSSGWAYCDWHGGPPGGNIQCLPDSGFLTSLNEQQADLAREYDGTLYVASLGGLDIITRGNSDSALQDTTHVDVPAHPFAMELDGTRLWVISEDNVTLLDVSDPKQPALLASFDSTTGSISRSRLRNGMLEAERSAYPATELLVLAFDDTSQQLLSSTSEQLDSVWFTEGHTWARSLDTTSVSPIEVDAGRLVTLGPSVALPSETLLGLSERDSILRLVTVDSATLNLAAFALDANGNSVAVGQSAFPLGNLPSTGAVRFDGDRAVFANEDRSATIGVLDFSDPVAPALMGELPLPTAPKAIALHGTTLLTFEVVTTDDIAGQVRVSQYDVGELFTTDPVDTMDVGPVLNTLTGSPYSYPRFSAASFGDTSLGAISYTGSSGTSEWPVTSGIQLFRFGEGGLSLLGQTEGFGTVGRFWLRGEQLLGLLKDKVVDLNVSSPQAPVLNSLLTLKSAYDKTMVIDDQRLIRLGTDPWTGKILFETVLTKEVEQFSSNLGSLWLDELLPAADPPARPSLDQSLVEGTIAYISLRRGEDNYLIAISLTAIPNPTVIGVYAGVGYPVTASGSLVVTQSDKDWWLVDTSTPEMAPTPLPLPNAETGWEGPIFFDDSVVVSSHFIPGEAEHTREYYLDRVDVTVPQSPVALPSLNVPGWVLTFNAELGRATVARPGLIVGSASAGDCSEYGSSACTDTATDECRVLQSSLMLLSVENDQVEILDTYELEPLTIVGESSHFDNRLVTLTSRADSAGGQQLVILDGVEGESWEPLATFGAAGPYLTANAQYAATMGAYVCMPSVVDIRDVPQELSVSVPVTCGPCAESVAVTSREMITTHNEMGARLVPLE
jgi:hypothetical protein